MSKVYSFRLNEDNPREAQATKAIDAWISKGYSLRFVLTDAVLSYGDNGNNRDSLNRILKEFEEIFASFKENRHYQSNDEKLSKVFVQSMKQSVRSGIRLEE